MGETVIVMEDEMVVTSIGPERQVVSVERRGQAIVVQPPCAEVFAVLQTMKHVYASRRGLGGRTLKVAEDLFKVEDAPLEGPQTVVPAGLESVALHLLGRAGLAVTYSVETVLPPRAIPAPDAVAARRLGPVDRAMLDLVHDHDHGLVRFKSGAVKPARLIAQIALAFPDMTIAVAAKRRADVRRLGRLLREHLPGTVDVVDGPCPKRLRRVVVASFLGLGEPAVEIEKKDVLIVPDAAEAHEANARLAIPHAEAARLFGFLAIGRRLAPFDEDWATAVFGLEEVVIPRHGHVGRPVEVVAVSCVGGRGRAADLDTVALKREGLWRHGLRNRRIAALARALADGDRRRLDAEYPAVAGRLEGRPRPLKVAVLVENIEHALAVAGRLPGWPIVAGPHVATVGLPGRPAGLLAQRRWAGAGTPARAIVTVAGLDGSGLQLLDVLVRADGGQHVPPALDGIAIRASAHVRRPLLVVDLDDRRHPRFREWARRRRVAYMERGWVAGRCRSGHEDRAVPGRPAGGGAMSTYSRTRHGKDARPGMVPGDYYRRRRQRRASAHMDPGGPTLASVADPEHLIATFHAMKAEAGRAPGPDRVTFEGLGPSELAACLRAVSRAILDGSYGPGPSRKLAIPKPGGGHRTLSIPSLFDRVVSKAVYREVMPVFERVFLDGSHGFRPGRSPLTLLAALEAMMIHTGRTVLALDDVKKAFDNVVIADVMEDLREHIKDRGLLTLIEAVIRGGEDRGRAVGIAQGDPFNPLLLNVRLHNAHDVPMTGIAAHAVPDAPGTGAVARANPDAPRDGVAGHTAIDDASGTGAVDHAVPDAPPTGAVDRPPWLRYADNLVYAARSVTEGTQTLDRARRLLGPAGHTLKGEDGPPVDLRTGEAQLLGFTLSLRDNRLHLGPGEAGWRQLARDLEQAHDAEDPPTAARRAVEGWLACFGAAFESSGASDLERVYRVAAALGFRELTAPGALRERIKASCRRWRAVRRTAHHRHPQGHTTGALPDGAAPPAPATPGG